MRGRDEDRTIVNFRFNLSFIVYICTCMYITVCMCTSDTAVMPNWKVEPHIAEAINTTAVVISDALVHTAVLEGAGRGMKRSAC